jgi:hypothetical protein
MILERTFEKLKASTSLLEKQVELNKSKYASKPEEWKSSAIGLALKETIVNAELLLSEMKQLKRLDEFKPDPASFFKYEVFADSMIRTISTLAYIEKAT